VEKGFLVGGKKLDELFILSDFLLEFVRDHFSLFVGFEMFVDRGFSLKRLTMFLICL
jgi:hypothetical protein